MAMKRRRLLLIGAVALGCGALPQAAGADPCPAAPVPGPTWFEFSDGSVQFRQEVFARPGLNLATTGVAVGQALRAGQAATGFWKMGLQDLVGTPAAPASSASVPAAAESLLAEAQASSACAQPVIALNELMDADAPQPWSAATRRYRENVALLLSTLAGRASTYLLVPGSPADSGIFAIHGSEEWWTRVSQAAVIVPEVYFDARAVSREGSDLLASRLLRQRFRRALAVFTGAGIPPARLGLMLGFQSGRNQGGREGLSPSPRWFETVKLQALAARDVALDSGVGSVWSWGWGTFATPGSADADKSTAACVYLWSRDPGLCIDAPDRAGSAFDADLTSGTLALPPGAACAWDDAVLPAAGVDPLSAAAGSRAGAARILLTRRLEDGFATVGLTIKLRLERGIVAARYHGSRAAYRAALARSGLTPGLARDLLADELRQVALGEALVPEGAGAGAIARWRRARGAEPTRRVRSSRPVWWLGGAARGVALSSSAPAAVFAAATGRRVTIADASGPVTVTVVDGRRPLRARVASRVRPAIEALLARAARDAAAAAWVRTNLASLVSSMRCARDELPDPGLSAQPIAGLIID